MPAIGSGNPTLLDLSKRMAPDGSVETDIIENLEQRNPFLTDMTWIEGNLLTGNRSVIRTGLPPVYYRLLNQGVPTSKSTTVQVDDSTAMLEAWLEVDQRLADLGGNADKYRSTEAVAFEMAMGQQVARSMFYGNSATAPETFNGLSVRYSSLTAANGQNIIDGGGTGGDNMSIWLVGWSPATIFGIVPKGSNAGLKHTDHGLQVVETTAGIPGSRMMAYREHWQWDVGLTVRDWRFAVRIANISSSATIASTNSALITTWMTRALYRIPNLEAVKPVFYMNRTAMLQLDLQRQGLVQKGGGVTYDNVNGQMVPSFRGVPIRISDVLLETEARVV